MSLKSISGMMLEPFSTISGISSRRSLSRRSHESRIAPSLPLIKRALTSAYSGASGVNWWPDSEANASDMSPGRLEAARVAAVRAWSGERTDRAMDSMVLVEFQLCSGVLLLVEFQLRSGVLLLLDGPNVAVASP